MTLEHIEGLPSGVALCLGHFPVVGRRERRSSEEVAVGAILCDLFGCATLLQREHDATGRPFLPSAPEQSVSISHAEGHVAVLLTPSTLRPGVDIETYRPQLRAVAPRYLTEVEWDLLEHSAPSLSELQLRSLLWSAKETAFKIFGPPDASLHSFALESIDTASQELRLGYAREATSLTVHYTLRPDYLFTFGWHKA